ncbi:MAG: uroporphyrinogen decarboxylase family protein [Planctomycetota bacterium]
MRPKDVVLEQIHHRETSPIPFVLGFEGDVAERLDGHYGGPEWRERLTPYIVGVAAVESEVWGTEPVDDCHTRDAFGTVWRTNLRPAHLEEPGLKAPSFDGYDFPTPDRFIADELAEYARKQCEEHADSFLVAGFGFGLFERSWTVRGFENALMDVAAEPDFYEELLDRILELQLEFVRVSADLPVDGIMFSDDWGDQRGVIIGPDRWRKLLKPRLAKLYQAAHDAGKLALSHCCGSIEDIMGDVVEIGLDVLESVQPEAMSPYELKKKWGDRIVFWGGLGSQSMIPFGTPQDIKDEVGRLCREMGEGGGYILAPAKALQPETPTENGAAVLEAFTNQDF